ncbi:MAG: ribonuclease T2 family protein, partial [Aeromonas veronii]
MKKMIALLAGSLLLSSAVLAKGEAGEFDYYAMALS